MQSINILIKSVCAVRILQATVLAPSSREISQTVRIDCHSFLSRVRISVWSSKILIGEKPKTTIGKTECSGRSRDVSHNKLEEDESLPVVVPTAAVTGLEAVVPSLCRTAHCIVWGACSTRWPWEPGNQRHMLYSRYNQGNQR